MALLLVELEAYTKLGCYVSNYNIEVITCQQPNTMIYCNDVSAPLLPQIAAYFVRIRLEENDKWRFKLALALKESQVAFWC